MAKPRIVATITIRDAASFNVKGERAVRRFLRDHMKYLREAGDRYPGDFKATLRLDPDKYRIPTED